MADDIKTIVDTILKTKIMEALHEAPEAIDKMIQAAMSQPVDEYGQKPQYSHQKSMPFLDWLIADRLRTLVKTVVDECITENLPAMKERVKSVILSPDSSQSIGEKVSEAVTKLLSEDYRWDFKVVSYPTPKERD